MTGYANAVAGPVETPVTQIHPVTDGTAASGAPGTHVNVEIRSVNGRFLDLAFRLPDELRSLEPTLRELLTAQFKRGKIELRIHAKAESEGTWPQPQTDQLNRLTRLESMIHGWLPKAQGLSVHEVLQWCKGSAPAEKIDALALDAARHCIAGLRDARAREGKRLVAVLSERVEHLRTLATQAEPLVPASVKRQQQRFLERWQEALEVSGAAQTISRQALEERAVNEAAAYAIRIDVAEELARLRSHLDEIARLLKAGGEIGKRLEFLIQEMVREVNTIGSKANHLPMTQAVLAAKSELEKLREQTANIE
jgi:uncharacterized protein (TIGR00255 family)